RTPLTTILSWTGLLRKRGEDPAILAKGVSLLEQSAKAQAQVIDDLLDISRFIMGKLVLKPESADICQVVRNAAEALRTQAEEKGLLMQVDTESCHATA